MPEKDLMKAATIGILVFIVGMIGHAVLTRERSPIEGVSARSLPAAELTTATPASRRSPRELTMEFGRFDHSDAPQADRTTLEGPLGSSPFGSNLGEVAYTQRDKPTPTVRVGKIGDVPNRDKVLTLANLPRSENELNHLYRNARNQVCQIMGENLAVEAPYEISDGVAGRFGRINAITIGLTLDEEGRSRLPSITQKQVLRYFEDHRLSIQPMLFHDETGNVYFANECSAAFYELKRPSSTRSPEPMIQSAVSRFRSLGLSSSGNTALGSKSSVPMPSSTVSTAGRTLVMAFSFQRAGGLVTGAVQNADALELLFLHLPKGFDPRDPYIEVFITQHDRSELHRLNTRANRIDSPATCISAKIRFDKTTMLGMYPAEPVVTDIQFSSAGAMPMASLMQLIEPSRSGGGKSLSEILDSFSTAEAVTRVAELPGTAQESWLEQMRQEKQAEFDSVFRTGSSANK